MDLLQSVAGATMLSIGTPKSNSKSSSRFLKRSSRNGKSGECAIHGAIPGSDPYARKTVTFESELDQATWANLVAIKRIGVDRSPFRIEHDPRNPAADSNGMVKFPNVDLLMEMADMREANRSYEANLQVIKRANSLNSMTLDLLKLSGVSAGHRATQFATGKR